MPKEMIFDGFRIVMPLPPESKLRVEKVLAGMKSLKSQLPRAGLFMSAPDKVAIADALGVIVGTCEALLLASDAAAAPSSRIPPK